MKILLTYDIADSKNRTKIATLLEGYGLRVNYSVFELDIKKQILTQLLTDVEKLSDKEDSVRLYYFSQDTIFKSKELKNRSQPFVKCSAYVEHQSHHPKYTRETSHSHKMEKRKIQNCHHHR